MSNDSYYAGLEIGEAVRPFAAAILIFPNNNIRPEAIITGGTCGLIRTQTRQFLVTNKHVTDALVIENRIGVITTGDYSPINISRWNIIDQDSRIGVATIEIPDDFDESTIGRQFCYVNWPPHRVTQGENVFFVGYPGLHREVNKDEITISVLPFCDSVSSTSDCQFVLADEQQIRSVIPYTKGLPDYGSTGGVSGALVYVCREGSIVPVGVLYEGGETEHAVFFVAHLDLIKDDGTIDRLRIP